MAHEQAARAGLTTRGAVLRVLLVAAAVHLSAAASMPLIIGNDGVGYLLWGERLAGGQSVDWPAYRTPGYPCFLALLFRVFGVGPDPVVWAQHLLGVLSAGLIAWTAAHVFRPRNGLIVGILAAVDPVFVALASHAMSETLATFLLVAAAALILIRPRLSDARLEQAWARDVAPVELVVRGALLGGVLACLCLVRPAFQVVVPFFALALLVQRGHSTPSRRRFAMAAAALGAGFLSLAGPWVHHNSQRGIRGFSGSSSLFLWIGMSNADLLDLDAAPEEEVRRRYVEVVKPRHEQQGATHAFLNELGAWEDREKARLLTRWAVRSIGSSPGKYVAALPRGVGWQLDLFREKNEMAWFLKRPAEDGRVHGHAAANFNFDGGPEGIARFAMPAGRGPAGVWIRMVGRWGGTPALRVPLFAVALLAVALTCRRGRWELALVLGGTLAYVGVHVAFLLFNSRFSAPCWMVWYLAPAALGAAARSRRGP